MSELNVNVGGTKNWHKVPEAVRRNWRVLDVSGRPDYRYDLNSGEPMPFADQSVDNFYTSHTLEHVRCDALPYVLLELHRALRPGGLLRVVVPDVRVAIRKYLSDNMPLSGKPRVKCSPPTPLGILMSMFYSHTKYGPASLRTGHRSAFDVQTLCWYLRHFRGVGILRCNECSPVFEGMDFARHKDVSIYAEARK